MKTLAILALSAGLASPVQATTNELAVVSQTNFDKAEITAILDVETKASIEITPFAIAPSLSSDGFTLIARTETKKVEETAAVSTMGDE
ncbi:hypothetical protein PN836_002055 [Ningiella sp. W23]|uniref:hypothetical protein n=1 Tax=Ningiella sp. W23 TaxID=3023715 RepID=UPI003757FA50